MVILFPLRGSRGDVKVWRKWWSGGMMGLSVRLRLHLPETQNSCFKHAKAMFLWGQSRDGSSKILWSYQESGLLLSSCSAQGHLRAQNNCQSSCHCIHIPSSIIPRRKKAGWKGPSPLLASSREPLCKSSPHLCLHLIDSHLVTWLHSSAKGLGSVGLRWACCHLRWQILLLKRERDNGWRASGLCPNRWPWRKTL